MKIMILGRSLESDMRASWYYLVKQLAKMENVLFYGVECTRELIPVSHFSNLPLFPRINLKLGKLWFRSKNYFRSTRVIEDVVKTVQKESPDVILIDHLFATGTQWKSFSQVKIPKAFILADIHEGRGARAMKYVEENNIDLFLVIIKQWMNTPGVKKWIKRKKVNARWLPWSVNRKIFRDYGLSRNFDVVSTGVPWQKAYPFRALIGKTLSRIPDIRFSMPKHPKFELAKGKPLSQLLVRQKYAKFLSQSKILIFSDILHYPTQKYTEGMACNTLVMAPMPMDGADLHFVPDENFVEVNLNNFLEKIRYYLKHDDERRQIALHGVETARKYHSVEIRARQLLEYFKSIL